ncbi:MAG: PH domain-containing protein [Candidatus Nanohaloarchaea archaeon]|nr:PH domain-containing protein [Candidatus Nanohaloarchaea archaeon]
MFSSVQRLLEEGEELEKTLNPSRLDRHYITGYGVALLLSIVAVGAAWTTRFVMNWVTVGAGGVGGFLLIWFELRRRFTMYHFTTRKIIEERGVLNKDIYSVMYTHIIEVAIEQDADQRMFGIGDIHVETAGTDSTELTLHGVGQPAKLKREIGQRLDAHGPTSSRTGEPESQEPDQSSVEESRHELEAQLGQVELRKKRLEGQYERGEIGDEAYRQRWYRLEGAEDELIEQIDSLDYPEQEEEQPQEPQEEAPATMVTRLKDLLFG